MRRTAFACLLWLCALLPHPLTADPRAEPGPARGFDHLGVIVHTHNDFLVDSGRDRWRTGGAALVQFLRLGGTEAELRLRGEFITPWNSLQAGIDRPPAAIAGAALFVGRDLGGALEAHAGIEVLRVGASLFAFQQQLHEYFNLRGYNYAERGAPIRERSYGALHAEIAARAALGPATLRPFAGFEVGFENFSRLGIDAMIGGPGFAHLSSRDPVSGFLLPAWQRAEFANGRSGTALVLGVDVARDHGSNLFERGGVLPTRHRARARLGVAHSVAGWTAFAGVTRLSREFEGQIEPQVIGTLALARTF
jgi:hypothetical protein